MKMLVALSAIAVALTVTGFASAGNPDPRKCHWNNARQCGSAAATLAVRRSLTKRLALPSLFAGDVTCVSRSPKFLLWGCTMKTQAGAPTTATVKFWATGTGWHTLVTLGPS